MVWYSIVSNDEYETTIQEMTAVEYAPLNECKKAVRRGK